jgi:hypothetical protein
MARHYAVIINKGGSLRTVNVQATSQGEAKKIAEMTLGLSGSVFDTNGGVTAVRDKGPT